MEARKVLEKLEDYRLNNLDGIMGSEYWYNKLGKIFTGYIIECSEAGEPLSMKKLIKKIEDNCK